MVTWRQAQKQDQPLVVDVVHSTIRQVYPHYYPQGAVEYFLRLHSGETIDKGIAAGEVYVLEKDGAIVATGSVAGNNIKRVFVLPQHQRQGHGSSIMQILEEQVFNAYEDARLSASLPAVTMYLRRQYVFAKYTALALQDGDFLCYFDMVKKRPK